MAVSALSVSAFAQYVLSRPEITTDAQLTQALAFFSFVFGGPGCVVGLGLLIAGIDVPAFILRLVPRWFAAAGLALALLAELSSLSMLVEPLQYLLPPRPVPRHLLAESGRVPAAQSPASSTEAS